MSTTTSAVFLVANGGYGAAEMASTSSPTCSSSICLARSAWLTMPMHSVPSTTGRRRTACSFIVRNASSIESSAPMVTVSPSPWPSSPALTDEGSLPCAITFTTMSRSVIMPLRRLSEPQIGIAPTSSSARRLATSATDWSSCAHSAPLVMTSRAVLAMLLVPPLLIRGSAPGVPAPLAKMQGVRRPRLAADLTPLRVSRELRLLVLGNFVSGMGTQAALVALPYQVYIETHSALKTGLLGAAELLPLVTMALLGGALADRADRRRLLLIDQVALVAVSATLCALAIAGSPPLGA